MITFSTKNWLPITYLQRHGEQLLQLMGCTLSKTATSDSRQSAGILPAETLTAALASLDQCCLANMQARLAHDQQTLALAQTSQHNANDEPELEVSLATRAYPLIELLRVARDYQQPVIWQQVHPARL